MYQGPYESIGLITIITVISCMRRWVCLTNGNIYIQKQGNPLEIVLRKNDVSSVLINLVIEHLEIKHYLIICDSIIVLNKMIDYSGIICS